jgi:hypothetical protein
VSVVIEKRLTSYVADAIASRIPKTTTCQRRRTQKSTIWTTAELSMIDLKFLRVGWDIVSD